MIKRCTDPAHAAYPYYGGRGIEVCQRWLESKEAFLQDVSPRPPGMTLERIDNDKGYSPDNVRWATRAEQVRNKRDNVNVMVDGERMVLKDACDKLGLSYMLIQTRMKKLGWSFEKASTTPVQERQSPEKAVASGGSPDWKQCAYCRQYDAPKAIKVDGSSTYHRECRNSHYRAVYAQKKGT